MVERYGFQVEMLPGSNHELQVIVQAADTGVQLSKRCNIPHSRKKQSDKVTSFNRISTVRDQ